MHTATRSLIASFKNRNRLMIQLRTLFDEGKINMENKRINQKNISQLRLDYSKYYQDIAVKNSYNIFNQNLWYLIKLTEVIKNFSLKSLIQIQLDLNNISEKMLLNSKKNLIIMQKFVIHWLS